MGRVCIDQSRVPHRQQRQKESTTVLCTIEEDMKNHEIGISQSPMLTD